SEGTLAIVTKVIVRLLHKPEATVTLLAIFDAVTQASRAVSAIIGRGMIPAALEMMDKNTMEAVEPFVHAGYPPDAGAVLLIEVEGLREAAQEQADAVVSICRELNAREIRIGLSQEDRDKLWAGRKGALGALGRLAPSYYILDGVIPRTLLPTVLDGVYEACERFGFRVANVFHAGDGNLHPNVGDKHAYLPDDSPTFAVDGMNPKAIVEPRTYEEVGAVMRYASQAGLATIASGGRTKPDIGNLPARYDLALSLSRLDQII